MSGAPLVILLATAPAGPAAAPGPVTLVLPLEPAEAADAHAWVGPAVSQLLARGLAAAGVPVAGRVEQLRAQAALELPRVSLTRATSLRIAEALGAGRLVVGTYQLQADELQVSSARRSSRRVPSSRCPIWPTASPGTWRWPGRLPLPSPATRSWRAA